MTAKVAKNINKLVYCTNCVMPSTRPRISFDHRGWCNACAWAEEKKTKIDWPARRAMLEKICETYRRKDGIFDCIVPVSGGKDSSYVAYMMKQEMGMHPLCVNIIPPLEFDVGRKNLENFIGAGYDCIRVAPNPIVAKRIGLRSLVDHGQPLMSWIINVQVAVFKLAIRFEIPLVMFGEEGETEYGGSNKLKASPLYDIEDSIKLYLSGINPTRFLDEFTEKELYWWLYPSENDFRKANLAIAHWSFFENWDPYHHYLVAKEKCNLEERDVASTGTYNNFAQTDTCLYDLHTYLMYLKFGFGRCSQDVGIDIRRGAMTRKQGINLIKKYDGEFPEKYVGAYLDYFGISAPEFDEIVDKWANKSLFEKSNRRWVPTFAPF